MTPMPAPRAAAAQPSSKPLALFGWMAFDWASQPFYTLITTFLFSTYFATVFIGDAAAGQALWGYILAAAGVVVALTSPIIGAIADAQGRLKRWIAVFSVVFVAAQLLLWFAPPNAAAAEIWLIAFAMILATVAAEYATVFNNALLPAVAGPANLGRVSGAGWAAGYFGGLVSLALVAGFVASDPQTGKSLLGLAPIIPNDAETRAADRLVGPISALWYALFIIPFFLFAPDLPQKSANGWREAAAEGLASLRETFRRLRDYKDIAIFLVARMLYTDGLSAIFIFGGLYAGAVFGWGAMQLGAFGIILTIAAALGGLAGGVIEDRVGARPVILGALALVTLGGAGALSIDRDAALFGLAASGAGEGGGAFASFGERLYIGFAILIGLAAGPLQASSRSLLARMAPEDKMTEFFGLFAFSGKVTSFAAPLLVAAVTQATESQRLGLAAIVVFLIGGFAVMLRVNPRRHS